MINSETTTDYSFEGYGKASSRFTEEPVDEAKWLKFSGAKQDLKLANEMRLESRKFKKTNRLNELTSKKDLKSLSKYFLAEIVDAAKQRYKVNNKYSLLDLISVGNQALNSYLKVSTLNRVTLPRNIVRIVTKAIQEFELHEELDLLNTDYSIPKLKALHYEGAKENDHRSDQRYVLSELEKAVDIASISGFRKLRFKQKHAIGEGRLQAMTNAEIADSEISKVGSAAIHASLPAVMRKVERYLCDHPEREAISSIVNTHQRPLLKELHSHITTKSAIPIEEITGIDSLFENASGLSIQKFQEKHNLTKKQMADFLVSFYPRLKSRAAQNLVSLSRDEIDQLDLSAAKRVSRIKDASSLDAIITETSDDNDSRLSLEHYRTKVREEFFPIFIKDKAACLAKILVEKEKAQSSVAKSIFQSVYNFYDKQVPNFKVEGLKSHLDDYQRADVAIMAPKGSYMVASDMGVGKSIEAISYALKRNCKKVLVISSKSGASVTWPKELKKHLKNPIVFNSDEIRKDGFKFKDRKDTQWAVATYSFARNNKDLLQKLGFDLIVLDESHKINNEKSAQSRAILSLEAPNKLAVSGSIFKNRREELYPVAHWLFPKEFPSQQSFLRKYCKGEDGAYRLRFDLQDKMTCRLKDQVLTLPPVQHHREDVTMTETQEKKYRQLVDDFAQWVKDHQEDMIGGSFGQATLTKLHKLRQQALNPKFSVASKIAKQKAKKGGKTVIYTTYVGAAEQMLKRLKDLNPQLLKGASTNEQRKAMVEKFTNDPESKVLVVTAAGGDSIDLTAADTIVFLNKPLTYADEKQMLDRLHRRGQEKEVDAYHLITADTIDERIEEIIQSKREEYDKTIRNPQDYSNWYEEVQSDNVNLLLEGMLA